MKAISLADRQAEFLWSGLNGRSAREHSEWCRGESEKLRMLWMYLRYCAKRAPETSREPMVQRLKFLLKQVEDTAREGVEDLPLYEDMDRETRKSLYIADGPGRFPR